MNDRERKATGEEPEADGAQRGPWEMVRDDETGDGVRICRSCERPYPIHERGCEEGR
jgi:uncharacterized protein YbaR (Trm112 family)